MTEDEARAALHDDAYRYAYRRSLSARLAAAAALDAVETLAPGDQAQDAPSTTNGTGTTPAADGGNLRVRLLAAARASVEVFLPPSLPPRTERHPALQSALAALSPEDREFLLLHHWDGLGRNLAALASGQDPARLEVIEAHLIGALAAPGTLRTPERASGPGPDGDREPNSDGDSEPGSDGDRPGYEPGPPSTSLHAMLAEADPARRVTADDLARSRRALLPRGITSPEVARGPGAATPPLLTVNAAGQDPGQDPEPAGRRRGAKAQAIIGGVGLVVVAAALAAVFHPGAPAGPSGEVAGLFSLADVVAVVSTTSVEPTLVRGRVRIHQHVSVVQTVKGEEQQSPLAIDVTGRSTLERPYGRDFFPKDQIVFLVRGDHGALTPIESAGAVLTLADRRTPAATTIPGDPVPLPDVLLDAIDAVPDDELAVATSGEPPGSLDRPEVLGVRPTDDLGIRDPSEVRSGTFRGGRAGAFACLSFEFEGRRVLLRWPQGFSAYLREHTLTYRDGNAPAGDRILTVLNERGYPYVDENRSAPFILGRPTGDRGICEGRELDVWDIAVAPDSTLLF
ncbi:hypothetical protein FJV46_09880 [Arthrobacter agilis]|uniref:hypothetical protein n=1 Tax=Arthrobacter agilis TaxID=37921 RepID=UPI000B35AAAC|nr:hypothetical protein [Arthrobacter agilis]PPB46693.1 hypothetical protein CI784_05260 [Arthrobacter agilis]TPV24964.1 hypothetical protein FJV46_09880 [Arthrobacter agilis]VDR31139.1 Uncharacterised protein [Arthrobacter agilis]